MLEGGPRAADWKQMKIETGPVALNSIRIQLQCYLLFTHTQTATASLSVSQQNIKT